MPSWRNKFDLMRYSPASRRRQKAAVAEAAPQAGLPALSSGEAELRAMTRGTSEAIFVRSVLAEIGVQVKGVQFSDSTAALRNASKLGPGKMRHLMTGAMFVEEAVRASLNTPDLLTKHLGAEPFARLCKAVCVIFNPEPVPEKKVKLVKLNVLTDIEHLAMVGAIFAAGVIHAAAEGELVVVENRIAFAFSNMADEVDWILVTKVVVTLVVGVVSLCCVVHRSLKCCRWLLRPSTKDAETQAELGKECHDVTYGGNSVRYHTNPGCVYAAQMNPAYVKVMTKCTRCATLDCRE